MLFASYERNALVGSTAAAMPDAVIESRAAGQSGVGGGAREEREWGPPLATGDAQHQGQRRLSHCELHTVSGPPLLEDFHLRGAVQVRVIGRPPFSIC